MPTNIFLKNLASKVNPITIVKGPLAPAAYHIGDEPIVTGARTCFLNFNRDIHIINGQTYEFFTVFNLGPLSFTIINSITGTRTQSNFWTKVSVSNGNSTVETPQISDTGEVTKTISASYKEYGVVNYNFTVNRYSRGFFNDVDITVAPVENVVPPEMVTERDYQLPALANVSRIPLLDVWGEGRILDSDGTVSGFPQAYNLNKTTKRISNGPNKCQAIPNLVGVTDYDNPEFPVEDNSVLYMTLMGAPITEGTAKEMIRTLNSQKGVVILYNPEIADLSTFEANMGKLELKPNDPLNQPPFNQLSFRPVRVYGFPGVRDKDEL